MGRHNSAWNAAQSDNIMDAVESGDHAKLRKILMSPPEGLDNVLLAPSTSAGRRMRTVLMVAAALQDLALFSTVLRAVQACIDHEPEQARRTELWRGQLRHTDVSGMTVLMLAARGGSVGILDEVVKLVRVGQDAGRLVDWDHNGTTVLMHAASSGCSPAFSTILDEIGMAWPDQAVEEQQLLATSVDGRSILMYATRCTGQMGVLSVTHACERFLHPYKLRRLIKQVDDQEMTFLMHAVSGGCTTATTTTTAPRTSASGPSAAPSRVPARRRQKVHQQPSDEDGGGDGDERDRDEHGGGGDAAELGGIRPSVLASAPAAGGAMDPAVVVFKTAWWLVQEVLWKEQVREQLKATDAWGRSLLTHAVLSGRVAVFDAVFFEAQANILDDEVDLLLGINKDDGTETVMEEALAKAPKAMAARVSRRDQELKKSVALQERASTIEAKIQSFIPGKLIVIFQLLLPEVGSSNTARLSLLLVMSAIAPILAWAGSLVAREKPSSNEKRQSGMSLFLSAPAMFFWGLGTSTIAQHDDGLSWSPSTSAAALAVATIVIPGVDAFFASKKVEQWYDRWSCQRWRFSQRAATKWAREQAERKAAGASRLGGKFHVQNQNPYGSGGSAPFLTGGSSQARNDSVYPTRPCTSLQRAPFLISIRHLHHRKRCPKNRLHGREGPRSSFNPHRDHLEKGGSEMQRQSTPPRRKSKLWPRLKARTTRLSKPDTRPTRRRWSTAALALVAVGSVTFGLSSGFLLRDLWDRHDASRDAAAAKATATADAKGMGTLKLVKHFQSFEEYAMAMMASTEALPVPIVESSAAEPEEGPMALPLATIIGVQKSGTKSLRNHLRTHPLLAGIHGAETHFFDRGPRWYPDMGRWPGDGHEMPLVPEVAGSVLSEYAKTAMRAVNSSEVYVTVASSPRYVFNPLVPYRMKMVQPYARLILVLRDPTERYFSHLRMVMCSGKAQQSFEFVENKHGTWFHARGDASGYLKKAEESYEPYTPLCRGEGATSDDLHRCFKAMLPFQPLLRGLYAEQLERWLRVFDRSQILILDSAEMLLDLAGVLAKVSDHIGLPRHEFRLGQTQQHMTEGGCPSLNRTSDPDFFGEGGRYDQMEKEKDLFREWYRPHNQRLFELLGQELPWDH
eukprot:g11638.t1